METEDRISNKPLNKCCVGATEVQSYLEEMWNQRKFLFLFSVVWNRAEVCAYCLGNLKGTSFRSNK